MLRAGAIAGASAWAFDYVGGKFADVSKANAANNSGGSYFFAGMHGEDAIRLTAAQFAEKIAIEAAVGGVMSKLAGGRFGDGFMGAGVSAGLSPILVSLSGPAQTLAAATLGGTASVLTGGKFANGAVTAAFENMFNQLDGAKGGGRKLSREDIERDGRVDRVEAMYWSHQGNGDLHADISLIDLSQVSASEFESFDAPKSINILTRSRDGQVYGHITLTLHEGNVVTASLGYDKYDFNPHYPIMDNKMRNFKTFVGAIANGGAGNSYKIWLYGEAKIQP